MKAKACFLGTPQLVIESLKVLHHHPGIDLVHIVSQPDRAQGRGHQIQSPPVIEYAKTHKIDFSQTANINQDQALIDLLKSLDIDIFIVFAFSHFLSQKVLDLPKKGCFNIHPSLLPAYRGASPLQYALLNGEQTSGVSIQKMVLKMDAGDIAYQKTFQIQPDENAGELTQRVQSLAADALKEFLDLFNRDKITFNAQDETQVSFAPVLDKKQGQLDFSKMNAKEVINKIRGLNPWPGTYCFLHKKRLKIFKAIIDPLKLNAGEVSTELGTLVVGCRDQSLRLIEVQLEGKKRGSDLDLINGYKKGPIELTPEAKD